MTEPLDDLAARQGIQPIQSADDLACEGPFESDEEFETFVATVQSAREYRPEDDILPGLIVVLDDGRSERASM